MQRPDQQQSFEDYRNTALFWEEALHDYSQKELEQKPDEDSWSLAQVYSHWLDASHLYMLKKIGICLANPDKHADEELNIMGIKLLTDNEFPIPEAKVPVKTEDQPANNGSKSHLNDRVYRLSEDMANSNLVLADNPPSGKSGHRFFGFMDAYQWYRLIPIHMRHHFRQKMKLDAFLGRE